MTLKVFDFDAELLACASGDTSAFLNIYNHEAPTMHALLVHMTNDTECADDLLHDVFVSIWRNAAGYSPSIGTARSWIYSILRYKAFAWQKQNNTKNNNLPALNMPAEATPEKLPGAILSLPKAQLDVLLQAYLHGGSTSIIADRLNRSEPDITMTIENCLQHIDSVIQP